ncbi:MAG TPA: hypothetical protein VN519_10725 [Bryobacteraceae bacterium]|nr:hypothetical protein [Bryobacteraceae bacterium]
MAATLLLLVGCGSDVVGTYKNDKTSRTLVLTKEHKMIMASGDTADYAVDGPSIAITNQMFGGATGEIKGNTLTFPPASFDQFVGASLQGTWIKQ